MVYAKKLNAHCLAEANQDLDNNIYEMKLIFVATAIMEIGLIKTDDCGYG
jgi:hypothetical protein